MVHRQKVDHLLVNMFSWNGLRGIIKNNHILCNMNSKPLLKLWDYTYFLILFIKVLKNFVKIWQSSLAQGVVIMKHNVEII
jgi:hypothetical protein